jgi:hypothetical protein
MLNLLFSYDWGIKNDDKIFNCFVSVFLLQNNPSKMGKNPGTASDRIYRAAKIIQVWEKVSGPEGDLIVGLD